MGADHAIATDELGVVEGGIGASKNLIHGVARPALADADAPGERDAVLAGIEWPLGQSQSQILGDLDRLRQRLPFEQQSELVAAETPGHGVVQPCVAGAHPQRLVALLMAIGVVDAFEMVDGRG